jgi:hypothetical protein
MFVTPTVGPMVKVLTVVPRGAPEPAAAEVHPLQVAPNVAGDAAAVPSSIQIVPAAVLETQLLNAGRTHKVTPSVFLVAPAVP